jgi:hypothetical protein
MALYWCLALGVGNDEGGLKNSVGGEPFVGCLDRN